MLGFFLYTLENVVVIVFVTGEALICDWLNHLKTQQDICPCKNRYQAVNIMTLFDGFILHPVINVTALDINITIE